MPKETHVVLVPALGPAFAEKGLYLIHVEANGNPHCVSVDRSGESGVVVVTDGDARYKMSVRILSGRASDATNRSTMVAFR